MFSLKQTFTSSFMEDCQEESVPKSLLALVSMILDGLDIKVQASVYAVRCMQSHFSSHTVQQCKGRNILLRLRYSVVTQLPRRTRFHLWFSEGCGCCKAFKKKKMADQTPTVDGRILYIKVVCLTFFYLDF